MFYIQVDRFPHGYIWVANVKINDFDLNEYISLKGINFVVRICTHCDCCTIKSILITF